MPENTATTPTACGNEIRESTCIHTKKIYDSCQAKDCVEDLRLYPTCSSQPIIDSAMSLRAGKRNTALRLHGRPASGLGGLLYGEHAGSSIKLRAEATAGCAKCAPITGLGHLRQTFHSCSAAKAAPSILPVKTPVKKLDCPVPPPDANLPTAICEAVDPLILSMRLVDCCAHPLPSRVKYGFRYPPDSGLPFDEEITSRTRQPNGFTTPQVLSCTWSGLSAVESP